MVDWRTRVLQAMRNQGLTQEDLAPAFGVKTRAAVGHYLTGRSTPSIDQALAVAKRLGMSPNELFVGKPQSINSKIMEKCVADATAAMEEAGVSLPPEKLSGLIAYLYSEAESGNPKERDEVTKLLKIFA